jgi:hypothetical protein
MNLISALAGFINPFGLISVSASDTGILVTFIYWIAIAFVLSLIIEGAVLLLSKGSRKFSQVLTALLLTNISSYLVCTRRCNQQPKSRQMANRAMGMPTLKDDDHMIVALKLWYDGLVHAVLVQFSYFYSLQLQQVLHKPPLFLHCVEINFEPPFANDFVCYSFGLFPKGFPIYPHTSLTIGKPLVNPC